MRYFIVFIICISIFSISSCRKDFTTSPSFGKLEFSKDTVFLNTVFTNIGSATYNLKVYNRSNKDISIPSIQLENGINSNYRLNVDGIAGNNFNEISILAKDSMYVFIETTINFSAVPDPLYTDKILFDNGENLQDVDLVTLVQDANFMYPGKDAISMEIDSLVLNGERFARGRYLTDSELLINNTKPTVIYGYAAVPPDKTLVIEAGSKIYFHTNSGLIVDERATLKVNGTLTEKVVFEGDRLENSFSNVPGQWGFIWLRSGSLNNEIHHAQIKNGIVGLLVDDYKDIATPTLKIDNTEIYNHSSIGMFGRVTNIEANNIVIGSAGQYSLAATIGGVYNFTHCTFANYWNNSLRQTEAVLINNFIIFNDENDKEVTETTDLHAANFTNCIFDGNSNIEFRLEKNENALFNYNISNSMIKFNDTNNTFEDNLELDFTNPNYQNIILNGNPDFKNPQQSDFTIGANSNAVDKASASIFTLDILGIDRTLNPDIGAYQHIIFD